MKMIMHTNKWSSILFIALLALTTGLAGAAAGASLSSPTGLLTDGQPNPMAVDSGSILFTWKMNDSERGSIQTAYQILVASSKANIDREIGDVWDSGKVLTAHSAAVEFKGSAVSANGRYWWKVRVWENHGHVSPWSKAAIFDVGLSRSDWAASYIWDGTTNENNFAYFRKSFAIEKAVKRAKVYVSAHNDYILYFNGHLLGRGPARSNPYRYGQYNAYDVTKLVKNGSNVFAAMGHWQGNWNNSGINAQPAFLLEARFVFSGGSSSTIKTDASWKALAHTPYIETNPTYFGSNSKNRAAIRFDSRLAPIGWRTIGFDDSGWANATVVDRSNYHLFAQRAPMEREQGELKPVSITRVDGAWLVDFGRCIDGWPKLTMHANRRGDTVRVQYFEMKGEQYPAGWDEYICRGGRETWDANFGRHTSFRELKVTGYAGKLKPWDVRGIWAYCDADVAGRFRCSNAMVDSIYEMCVRSAQQNIQQGIISVDANREQSPWLADSYLIGNVLLYNDRNTMMIDKVVRDYAAQQLSDGFIPACSPGFSHWKKSNQIPEWAMYWPMLLWRQYLFSGDGTLLHQMAPQLTRFLDWIKPYQNPKSKLLNPPGWRISDWAAVDKMPSGGYNIATACQFYDDLRIASRIFSVLGDTDQSRDYRQQAEAVKAGINANLFNGKYYLVRTDLKEMWPLASAWPLRFDIEPAANKSEILAAIEQAGKPQIGGYGGDALYSGMLNAGDGEYVVRDLARYRPMLETDKANWESFELNTSRGYEVNHAWTSYPGYQFLKYFAGIRPTSGGFATFDVRPVTSGLTFVEGTVPTVKGNVTTKWKRILDGLRLEVVIPANSVGKVYVPDLNYSNIRIRVGSASVWENGKFLGGIAGIASGSANGGYVVFKVGSGSYTFTLTGKSESLREKF